MTAILTLLRSSRLLLLLLSVILMPSLPSLDDNLFSLCVSSLCLSISVSLLRVSCALLLAVVLLRHPGCTHGRDSRPRTWMNFFGPRKEVTNLCHLSSINREVTYVGFFHPLRRNVTGCQNQGISSGDGMRRCKSISHVQV